MFLRQHDHAIFVDQRFKCETFAVIEREWKKTHINPSGT